MTTTAHTTHTFAYIDGRAAIVTTSTPTGQMLEQLARRYGSGAIPAAIVRDFVDGTGSLYFSPDTMRGFASRLIGEARIIPHGDTVGIGFITSERDGRGDPTRRVWNGERRYTCRVLVDAPEHPHGFRIHTVAHFGAHRTAAAAKREQRTAAARVAWAF